MIIIDVETSGLDPKKYSILSIGAVDFDVPDRSPFYRECQVWDGALVSKEALAVNGFTEAECFDPSRGLFEDSIRAFWHWVEQSNELTIAGQNTSFDRDFINDSFRRAGIDFQFAFRTIDLHSVCYAYHLKNEIPIPLKNGHSALSLDKILEFVGMETESRPHHALNGAKLETEAFSRLLRGRGFFDEYQQYEIPEYLK
ncbi:MAG: hypothetical protein COZ49_02565 [Candidatus Yonathbacteria bacterium CG_4_10_14_3_um_filter_47_65]|uniref:Exonuclease domain-containing protein n=2 Tax=Parcubacteria group TaxID=1794811 RepID=A0A2M8D663_9BACT|nr:MAG: hypothetical protein AUJ44_01660 [Candidatus Nomurabacteria bacterium CG1_02_47_685]PIP03591.1 MAG: hypothetical protein COX54_03090 [Candidatus Yonathbacteria bacterium CG23_combo_of_CG06-09_8_20_14_all_46_18]PIQ31412.1 MAG: hypothetical protein COW61_03825 [Candidatus Yonathbacteria bacterium CG17_big_fil_post_rev_8_21_14_2_50_46_19]PIX56369.1 MAG: hypothetical protein COZ49_02565 [Candidatus Yonathbacteria bacterium CG_4_10_14_3_um_filter_47_65]PIY57517.1 MAG: hypothetical protein CO